MVHLWVSVDSVTFLYSVELCSGRWSNYWQVTLMGLSLVSGVSSGPLQFCAHPEGAVLSPVVSPRWLSWKARVADSLPPPCVAGAPALCFLSLC